MSQKNPTGSTDESKEKTDQQPGVDEEQNDEKLNQANEDEEGNLSDEGEEEQEGTGQQGQQEPPATEEEPVNLDLPDDLQLDEEGNEGMEGELRHCCLSFDSNFELHSRCKQLEVSSLHYVGLTIFGVLRLVLALFVDWMTTIGNSTKICPKLHSPDYNVRTH